LKKRYGILKQKIRDKETFQDLYDIFYLANMMFFTFKINIVPENIQEIKQLIKNPLNDLSKYDVLGLKSMVENIERFKAYEKQLASFIPE
jgi:hypothetical protein